MHVAAPLSLETCLQRVISAPERINFEGTFVVGSGNQGISSHIVHYGDGRGQLEQIERLDGPKRVVFRRGDEVMTLWPAERALSIQQHSLTRQFPMMPSIGVARIADHYKLLFHGSSRVAGRISDEVSLTGCGNTNCPQPSC